MNWEYVLTGILSLVIVFMILMTLMFYFQHLEGRNKNRIKNLVKNPVQGRYFIRYIPRSLKSFYIQAEPEAEKQVKQWKYEKYLNKVWAISSITIAISISVVFIFFAKQSLMPITKLTKDDIRKIGKKHYDWVYEYSKIEREGFDNIKWKSVVLISPEKSKHFIDGGLDLTLSGEKEWLKWAKKRNLESEVCTWRKINSCLTLYKNSLIVALPGEWDFKILDEITKKGVALILNGTPFQVVKNKSLLKWQGIQFHSRIGKIPPEIITKGDSHLSFEIPVGKQFSLKPLSEKVTITSDSAVAYRIWGRGKWPNEFNAAIVMKKINKSKVVLVDFSISPKNHYLKMDDPWFLKLEKSMLNYLQFKKQKIITTWPKGKKFAAYITQDTEEGFKETKKLLNRVKKSHFPMGWFVLSNIAEKNSSLVEKMSNFGSINCHGDNHDRMDQDSFAKQNIRLAVCKKSVQKLIGKPPLGFRPPEEGMNEFTISALKNNGFKFVFSGGLRESAAPIFIEDKKAKARIIYIGRNITDDYDLFFKQKLSTEEIIFIVSKEIDWIEKIGGLYNFSVHSQFIKHESYYEVLDFVVSKLKAKKAYFADVGEIVKWWEFRDQILKGKKTKLKIFNKFNPSLVKQNQRGYLQYIKMRHNYDLLSH